MGWIGALIAPPRQLLGNAPVAAESPVITVDTNVGRFVRGSAEATVFFKTTWSQDWVEQTYIECDLIHHRVGEQIGTATLRYRSGEMLRRDSTTFQQYGRATGPRVFVKIEFPTHKGPSPWKWYGVVTGRQTQPLGGGAYNQVITCHDLKWILTRHQVGASIVRQGGTSKRVDRAITFNESIGGHGAFLLRPNRSTAIGPQGTYLFEETLESAKLWRASDMLTYLTEYFQPMGGNAPKFLFDSSLSLIDWYTPTVDQESRTLFDLFNALIERKRGVTWDVEVEEDVPQFVCKVSSLAHADVTLPGGATILKNTAQKRLLTEDAIDVSVLFSEDMQRTYEQVIVRGAKRTGTGTFSHVDGTLDKAWTNAQEVAYKRGDPAIAQGTETSEAGMKHDAYRNQESLRPVYRGFTVPVDWMGDLPNDDVGVVGAEACPKIDEVTGLPFGETIPFWRAGLKWLPVLPLLEGVDYTDILNIPVPMSGVPTYLRPFVTFDNNWTSTFREFGHKLQSGAYTEEIDGGVRFTCQLRLSDGLDLYVQPTGIGHCLALNSFDWKAQAGTEFSDHIPQVDWQKMKLTACVEFDAYCEGIYPANGDVIIGQHDTISRMVVHVGERARLDWVAAGTEVDLETGAPVVPKNGGTPTGFFVRDDRETVERMSRAIYEWFATPRQAVTIQLNSQLNTQFSLGDLITEIDDQVINSVVTGITWDFVQSSTTLSTSYADIDFVRLP